MTVSSEVIEVLEYLGSKLGITIDWTSENVLPYVEQLCGKFVNWEIGTSIFWMMFGLVLVIAGICIIKFFDWDEVEIFLGVCVFVIAIGIILYNAYSIVTAVTFPELSIYNYIKPLLNR